MMGGGWREHKEDVLKSGDKGEEKNLGGEIGTYAKGKAGFLCS